MKKIFLIMMIMFTTLSFAQETKEQNVEPTNTETIKEAERLIDKYSDKIGEALKGLAENLKVPVEHVYQVLVKQQFAEGISIVGNIFIFFLCFYIINWVIKKDKLDWSVVDNLYNWILVICIGAVIVEALIIVFGINTAIIKIINPEYGAIKEIFEFVQGG